MEIYLIRHTTPSLSPGLIYGRLDVGLSDTFESEVTVIKEKLPKHFDHVYTSPSTRCVLLAQKINASFSKDDRLTEFNFGDWEGETWDSVNQRDLHTWMDDFVNGVVPGGESMIQMSERVLAFWTELNQQSYQKIAIVTHGGVIRLILAHVRQLALADAFDIKTTYGEVVKLNTADIKPR